MDLTVRDARAADADDIALLLEQLGYPSGASAVQARLERLAIVGDRVVVAEVDGRAVGVAHVQVSPALERERPVAKIGALVVDEEHRSQGVGRALLRAVEDEARARGCGLLFVTTSESRDDAHAFYERTGLEHAGRRYVRTLNE
jgi:GNAT superfamily N-acetyltransferase